VLSKEENAYASSWDLWMPHFLGIYRSGPDFTNGIHALPTLSSGVRLWEGHLGRPVSYGCIVVGVDEAATLYEWAELGMLVVIRD
jgi:lipoprotein-anchoring transpeptidase ErfK/SrfK